MAKDRLFLLPHDIDKDGLRWFCPPCAMVEGFLGWFPQVRDDLDIVTAPFPRPRGPVAELFGEDHPGSPVLVLAEGSPDDEDMQVANGLRYLDDAKAILRYLADRRGLPRPLGSRLPDARSQNLVGDKQIA
ncbi:DUF3088 family protein [Caulobacter sp. 17J80-11]|uniref:DUF3088 family protein n=1 Tax=Caulobacter sp. 17J80-11 TaxID=2763502 RepID=UPI001653C8CC|nr:DUF3088 family protein [Caulobacter sp. 17J80-11]MBC6983377.1 DUF3088 family protein [Caulobacter sp. 17J80-11]